MQVKGTDKHMLMEKPRASQQSSKATTGPRDQTKRFFLRPQARLPTVCYVGDDLSDLLSVNSVSSGKTTDEAVWSIRAQSMTV